MQQTLPTTAPRRLTALDEALAALARCATIPVAPRRLAPGLAMARPHAVLAEPLVAPAPLPATPESRRDGWAVAAQDTLGAAPQSPAPLSAQPRRVAPGETLPAGTDAVLGLFDVVEEFGIAHAIQPLAPGDGARGAGDDLAAGATLRAAGEALRAIDLPALAASGIAAVAIRAPRVAWIPVGDEIVADPARDRIGPVLAAYAAQAGADIAMMDAVPDRPEAIAAALRAAATGHDLLLLGGGTGEGSGDLSAAGLAAAGALEIHGIGMRPGASAGFGRVAERPTLLIPGCLDDALAAWIVLGRPVLAALAGAAPRKARQVRLTRKLASCAGIAELAAVAVDADGGATPLAIGALPLSALAAADGFVLVPAAAEGYEPGSILALAPL